LRRPACQRSYWDCIFIQNSGEVRNAAANRNAMLAEIPALPFNRRDRVTRVTRRCLAASETATPPRYSRKMRPGWGGLCILIAGSLVIVPIVHENSILAIECKGQSPISADTHGPMTGEIASQGMQLPAWGVHVRRQFGIVKSEQLKPQASGMFGLNSRLRPGTKELLQAAMAKTLNHCV
jgi:hypothetical protein